MKSYALAFVLGGILWVPAGLIGTALHLGGFGWLMLFVLILPIAALADRDFFYGRRDS